ncbi:MAG: hypothetical protein GY822_29265 [Deltaproteobacteria bacterium]|nr:hypothetical protein [Deltaproteobacteria bacterium]
MKRTDLSDEVKQDRIRRVDQVRMAVDEGDKNISFWKWIDIDKRMK